MKMYLLIDYDHKYPMIFNQGRFKYDTNKLQVLKTNNREGILTFKKQGRHVFKKKEYN